ncbi:hypothetical protein SAMN05421852_11129 [Thermoflavimicrobium dichotomicum]|uniref:Uncharacterized protein n=1 Tax=Thermoflavimicrobium dichotomicum TaxID=46223 RepID=A0A1I3RX24_9BACL|nr:hypothetical protein SAMN05421852_11129 [Thermoflavimicrobium dichotomicum]
MQRTSFWVQVLKSQMYQGILSDFDKMAKTRPEVHCKKRVLKGMGKWVYTRINKGFLVYAEFRVLHLL